MELLEKAMERARDGYRRWTDDKVQEFLVCISGHLPGAKYDWEAGNENWGSVWNEVGIICYLCTKVPIIIVKFNSRATIENCMLLGEAVVFEVNDFEDRCHKIQRATLEQIFEKPLSSVFDFNALSIRELWYATVS